MSRRVEHACNFQENPPVSNSCPGAARQGTIFQFNPPSLHPRSLTALVVPHPIPSHLLTHSPSPPSLSISQYRLKSLCAAHTFVQSKHSRGIEAEGANSNGYFLLHVRVHLPPPPPMFDQQYNGASGWVISVHPAFWGEGEVRAIKSPTLREEHTWVGDKKKNSPADRFISAE